MNIMHIQLVKLCKIVHWHIHQFTIPVVIIIKKVFHLFIILTRYPIEN